MPFVPYYERSVIMEYLVVLVDRDYNQHYYWFDDLGEAKAFYQFNMIYMSYCKLYKCNILV